MNAHPTSTEMGRGRGTAPFPCTPSPQTKPGRLHKTLDTPDLGEQTAQAWCYGLICNNSDYNSNALPWLTELF